MQLAHTFSFVIVSLILFPYFFFKQVLGDFLKDKNFLYIYFPTDENKPPNSNLWLNS